MRINVSFSGEVRRCVAREFTRKNGEKGIGYDVGVELPNGELGVLNATKELFDEFQAGAFAKGDSGTFFAEYDTQAKFFPFNVFGFKPSAKK